jgi:nitrile hydratase
MLFAANESDDMSDSQFNYPNDREKDSAAKVFALESLLIEKGIITDYTVDRVLNYFESEMTPVNGAKIVVRAWTDPDFAARIVDDTPSAIAEMDLPDGMAGAEGEHLQAVANAPGVHNLVICTLCSCFPWPVLGLPPYWYKDPTFRARAAREPRTVLAEVGVELPDDVDVRVWDSSGHSRWFVIPERPSGTENFTDAELMTLVTTESMIGVALAGAPG